MNFDIEDLSRALERLEHVPCVNFGLLQIRQVEQRTGPLEGLLRARALSALIDVQASDDLLCECADSIAACPQWEILLRELLAYAEIAPPTLDVLRLVLMARMPAHPLALRKKPFAFAFAVHDAWADEEFASFYRADRALVSDSCLVFDPANILDHISSIEAAPQKDTISLPLAAMHWITARKSACPTFAIAA